MKKTMMFLIVGGITFIGLFATTGTAKAVWSGWQIRNGYTARVYTDASTYTSRASSVDWRIQKKGSSSIYYTAHIYKWTSSGLYSGGSATGYFKSSTPIKKFSVPKIRRRLGSGTYIVRVFCYKNSKKKKQVGSFNSKKNSNYGRRLNKGASGLWI
ncbi:hypothetical protein [Bacillus haynesii]|uniref:hypothetical protein n=1 Tax=Bacillus haynesii TaxID=1925021 RepID=UPI00228184D5|nr:hypothetical protein [Bacillus haynesii]MCY7835230.1 hypothetical protein [Bacillus haynesii]MCY8667417.1 hypothetical protein [Bacillus haynesii]